MKSYSLSEIVYIDSPTLSALIGNHIAYSKETVILAQAELKRRGEFTDQLKESIDNFCISNKISQLDDAFYSVLEANDIAQSEWVQMGRDITPKNNSTYPSSTSFSENNNNNNNNNNPELRWEDARNGIIIFCVIHFIFEASMGNFKLIGPTLFFNFIISKWYVQWKINKGLEKNNYLLYGLMVSGIVFMIRVILGFIVGILFLLP